MKTMLAASPEPPLAVPHRRFWFGMAEPARRVPTVADPTQLCRRPPPAPPASRTTAVCRCSPRQMADLSLDLFLAGVLSEEEYALLAFQPELHPDFDQTIGALTGERAKPDQTRDYIASWRDRLDFERNRPRPDHDLIERIQRILFILRRLGTSVEMSMSLT